MSDDEKKDEKTEPNRDDSDADGSAGAAGEADRDESVGAEAESTGDAESAGADAKSAKGDEPADDADEKPAAKSKGDREEDDEDAPRSAKPAAKSKGDREEDDEDAPRSAKPSPKSKAPSERDDEGDSDEDAKKDIAAAELDVDADDVPPRDVDQHALQAGEHVHRHRKAAAWGRPLARLDRAWTTFEERLCALVLVLEILALSLWIFLKGLSTAPGGSGPAGTVFRALVGATVFGCIAYFGLKKQSMNVRRVTAVTGVVIGLVTAKMWGDTGVMWSSNILSWYQNASSLTLFGGLRGIGTRLTLLLALLGGSLATAAGKHITIDLLTRLAKPKLRMPMVIIGWVGSAVICISAAWGFFDHIAIESFDADKDATAGKKASVVWEGLGENTFIAWRQLKLDFKTLPHVLEGERYSEYLKGDEWNEFVAENGFVDRYGKEKMAALHLPSDAIRAPIVVVPGKGEPKGELIHAANLVFPIGLLIIGLRFLLRSALALSGHVSVDPDPDEPGGGDGDSPPDGDEESDEDAARAEAKDDKSADDDEDNEDEDDDSEDEDDDEDSKDDDEKKSRASEKEAA